MIYTRADQIFHHLSYSYFNIAVLHNIIYMHVNLFILK